tara:strand:+ start:514 stop:939 length:426 start_codon:yes stop_codon:yes gene_type:complete
MSKELFNSILSDDKKSALENFKTSLQQKMNVAMDVRRVGLTSKIFNGDDPNSETVVVEEETSLEEAVSPETFVGGGSDKVKQSEVDSLLGKIYDNTKLTKSLISNKAYKEGESNPKKKNPYKKDTVDYHVYQLGQQVELSR